MSKEHKIALHHNYGTTGGSNMQIIRLLLVIVAKKTATEI
jgi:hypothetical protein